MTTTPDFAPIFKLYDTLGSNASDLSVREIKDIREDAIRFLAATYDVVEHLGRIQDARAKVEMGLDGEVE